jgi:hypothetical protein
MRRPSDSPARPGADLSRRRALMTAAGLAAASIGFVALAQTGSVAAQANIQAD